MTKSPRLLGIVATIADTRPLPRRLDMRVTAVLKSEAYYESQMMGQVRKRYEGETDDNTFLLVMALLIAAQLRRAYTEGLDAVGVDGWDLGFENELQAIIAAEQAALYGLLFDIRAGIIAGLGYLYFKHRIDMWGNRYMDVVNRGKIAGGKRNGSLLQWHYGATEKHCKDCSQYVGQIKTAMEWDDIYRTMGIRPQSRDLECKGFLCDCWYSVVKK